jgi:glycosyltransferase involved in cell wall biosynthesis
MLHDDSDRSSSAPDQGGATVVICCHNSEPRLSRTLECVAGQLGLDPGQWDVLVVDNASSDNTSTSAVTIWRALSSPVPLKTVSEPRIGLAYARITGILESRRQFVCFVDDDNHLAPDWLANAMAALTATPEAAAIGGATYGVFEDTPPLWFEEAQAGYAVGTQAPTSGDVTDTRGYLWGAGLCLRRAAVVTLLCQGFTFTQAGRAGRTLGSGDDSELCLALRLAGWRLLYDNRLRLGHYMPRSRLRWPYAVRLFRGHGRSRIHLRCYRELYRGDALSKRPPPPWYRMLLQMIKQLVTHILRHPIASLGRTGHALSIHGSIGAITELLTLRSRVNQLRARLRSAPWAQNTL